MIQFFNNRTTEKIIELIKYGFWGVVTTIFNLILFYVMIKLGINYIITNVSSYAAAVVLSYYLNNKYVFKQDKKQSEWVKLVKFIVIRVLAIIADSGILILLVSYLKYDLMLSRIFLSIFIILATYILNKLFVFSSIK